MQGCLKICLIQGCLEKNWAKEELKYCSVWKEIVWSRTKIQRFLKKKLSDQEQRLPKLIHCSLPGDYWADKYYPAGGRSNKLLFFIFINTNTRIITNFVYPKIKITKKSLRSNKSKCKGRNASFWKSLPFKIDLRFFCIGICRTIFSSPIWPISPKVPKYLNFWCLWRTNPKLFMEPIEKKNHCF